MNATIGQNLTAVTGVDPAQRTQALADARREVSQKALQSAEAAEARRADTRDSVRAQLEQALGANTRLSVARNESALTFVYRAIDIESGEVVREWPPADFARFLDANGLSRELLNETGAVIDEQV